MLVRPRLTDFHNIHLPQAQTDFAIPFLDEDIPLYVDPFLLWRSPSQQDQALHTALINSFNHLGHLVKQGRQQDAKALLVALSECDEVGPRPLSHPRRPSHRRAHGRKDPQPLSRHPAVLQLRLRPLRGNPILRRPHRQGPHQRFHLQLPQILPHRLHHPGVPDHRHPDVESPP